MLILTSPPPHPRLHPETCFPGTSNIRQACLWQKNPASSRSYPLLTWKSKGDLEKCNTCCHSLLLCLSLMTSAIPGPPCCCFCHKKSHTPHTIGPILAPVFVAQRLHPSRQKAPLQPTLHKVSCFHRSEHNEGGLSVSHHMDYSPARAQMLSCLTFVTPQTVTCQAPLSMEFSRQEYWHGLQIPPPGDLPNPGI